MSVSFEVPRRTGTGTTRVSLSALKTVGFPSTNTTASRLTMSASWAGPEASMVAKTDWPTRRTWPVLSISTRTSAVRVDEIDDLTDVRDAADDRLRGIGDGRDRHAIAVAHLREALLGDRELDPEAREVGDLVGRHVRLDGLPRLARDA